MSAERPIPLVFADLLRQLERAGWSMRAIAKIAGCNASQVSRWLAGQKPVSYYASTYGDVGQRALRTQIAVRRIVSLAGFDLVGSRHPRYGYRVNYLLRRHQVLDFCAPEATWMLYLRRGPSAITMTANGLPADDILQYAQIFEAPRPKEGQVFDPIRGVHDLEADATPEGLEADAMDEIAGVASHELEGCNATRSAP